MNYINEKKVNLLSQGNIIADRIVSYNSNEIDNLLKKYSKEIKSRIMLLDEKGIVINDSYDVLNGTKLEHWEVVEALKGKSVAREHELEGYGRVMYVTVPIILNNKVYGSVFISFSLEEVYNNVNKIMRNYFLLAMLCIVITGFISFIFAHVISTPIEKLTEGIKKMYQGNLEQKVEVIGNDELTNLAHAFNMMSTKLFQVDQQRKEFVANVSHELRTPLSAIKLLSESLMYEEKTAVETYREFLKDIVLEVNRLDKIIESLLALVDIDKGKLELNYEITYVNYLLEKLIHSLKPIAEQKKISIDFICSEKIQIELDRIKIQQALTNIIHNAIKYTPEGGKVDILLYSENDSVTIKVKDNGIGIPKESLPHIFERFYRVDKARARSTGGTGLGLSISKQIIELHQGEIEVTSEVDRGTVFYVRLPKNISIRS
ncbi:HAMP domain-containing sensor histidine kinase [Crassaminicella indica]|uniref:histidine kinase n=1 Tax=Crassaminicella indica TaxID=2855394 RepID=A0ABX8RAV8_9CLOT|nr:ATP-binding protein [Crassaminicella indica]QXM05921.1 cell wall metabolism sensor histidine kinase WalK [Crassaminicella indica]